MNATTISSMNDKRLTYISLFSSAGVGCYGFKQEGFECIATNEIIQRRLAVQQHNKKCKYDTGYIQGDISDPEVKSLLFSEISRWKEHEQLKEVDVVIATPPCQGMSVANHKKTSSEIIRNSLIIESIKLIKVIEPKVFIFENVPRFMKTLCTDTDGNERPIGESIEQNLGSKYSIFSRVLNFKNFGACSSRTRTLVIGVRRDLSDQFSPVELFPSCIPERTLRDVIGAMKPLKEFGQIDTEDIYHAFRVYPEHMRAWISQLSEGQSAFDNSDKNRIPHHVIDGQIVYNQRKNGDKYRRQIWDKTGPCVHTRNDQLASQNTVHPSDDRVFSIRELMHMMTVPDSFNWTDIPFDVLNNMDDYTKRQFLKKEEIKIRQSLGEAVPTVIFRSIAANIRNFLSKPFIKDSDVKNEIDRHGLTDPFALVSYIKDNHLGLGFASLCRITELANSKRTEQEAYFTNKSLITEMVKVLPEFSADKLSILEPSVGAGNFLPFIFKLFECKKDVLLTLIDIDNDALLVLKALIKHISIPSNIKINFLCGDFLTESTCNQYDIIIGNPPFAKLPRGKQLERYRLSANNKNATNTAAFFIEKAIASSTYTAMVMPKSLLSTPEFSDTRDLISKSRIDAIIDFGEKGFHGVLIETVAICINSVAKPANTAVVSVPDNFRTTQKQNYICDADFPYWIIYRNRMFDRVCEKMEFDIFEVFRDRQITNSMLCSDGIRVIRSRNIAEDGTAIIDIDGYDAYITSDDAKKLAVYKYISDDCVYLAPNMTYKPRLIQKPKGVLVNGSAAILFLKNGEASLNSEELKYFATNEYREFYRTARNRQTRSLNIDNNSVFFFGRLKTSKEHINLNEMAE